jgi:hypothetical protein
MANSHLALQVAHVSRTEDVSHQAISTMDMNSLALRCGNTSGILSAVLE